MSLFFKSFNEKSNNKISKQKVPAAAAAAHFYEISTDPLPSPQQDQAQCEESIFLSSQYSEKSCQHFKKGCARLYNNKNK